MNTANIKRYLRSIALPFSCMPLRYILAGKCRCVLAARCSRCRRRRWRRPAWPRPRTTRSRSRPPTPWPGTTAATTVHSPPTGSRSLKRGKLWDRAESGKFQTAYPQSHLSIQRGLRHLHPWERRQCRAEWPDLDPRSDRGRIPSPLERRPLLSWRYFAFCKYPSLRM